MVRLVELWCAALLQLTGLASAEPKRKVIYLQPLGQQLPPGDVTEVRQALLAFYGWTVTTLEPLALPKAAYYAPRRRWRAEQLLTFLGPRLPSDGLRVIGLTAVDISTTNGKIKDWGILGLGELPGRASVISTFRCHRTAVSMKQARDRLAKVAVHELGHTLGLPHCPTRGCLMHDAEGKVSTTDEEYEFCAQCAGRLRSLGIQGAPHLEPPWPRPKP
jgi:archaemetzincin